MIYFNSRMLPIKDSEMTKASTRKLKRGQEIFNVDTGEVSKFTASIGTVGETVFIESMDARGHFHIWPNKRTELV